MEHCTDSCQQELSPVLCSVSHYLLSIAFPLCPEQQRNNNCSIINPRTQIRNENKGSVSSTGGETGILGTTTVVKGEDKPPEVKLPGLDFTSEKGRKLLGY